MKNRTHREKTMTKDEYIAILEKRIKIQKDQLKKLRRRGRVLLDIVMELGYPKNPNKDSKAGRVLTLFEEDGDW